MWPSSRGHCGAPALPSKLSGQAWEEQEGPGGARGSPFPAHPGWAACPSPICRQSRPPGSGGQALHLVNLPGHSQPEPQSSQAPTAGCPPGPGLGSRLLLRPGICHRSARLTEPNRDPRNRPATEHMRCLLGCRLAPTVGLGRGCQPSKAGQQSLFRLLPWKFKCWEWR